MSHSGFVHDISPLSESLAISWERETVLEEDHDCQLSALIAAHPCCDDVTIGCIKEPDSKR
jgi:hypothetical protein